MYISNYIKLNAKLYEYYMYHKIFTCTHNKSYVLRNIHILNFLFLRYSNISVLEITSVSINSFYSYKTFD